MQIVILAGGFGTRLKRVSGDIPKPLVDVAGAPFLYRLLDNLKVYKPTKVVLALHYRAHWVIEKINRDKPVDFEIGFSVEEQPLGTGGGLKKACELISDDRFLAINGDTYHGLDYMKFMEGASDFDLFISAIEVRDRSRYGAIEVASDGRLSSYRGTGVGSAGLINGGSYGIRTDILLDTLDDKFAFEDLFLSRTDLSIGVCEQRAPFVDIGVPDDYEIARQMFS